MAKKTRVSAREYKPLRDAFYNAKYASSGVLARLLLEAFLFEDGDINADWFVRERVCSKGAFSKLRERLVHDGWLHFRADTKRYFPGVRLKPHLDAVKEAKAVTFADIERKADKSEIAELDDKKADKSALARVADDVQDLKAQIRQIYELIAELKRLQAPPPSAEAQARSGEIAEELQTLMLKTGFKVN
jgi:hypothetical protein